MTVGDELKQPSPEWCQPIGFGCVNGGAGRGVTTQETTQETEITLSEKQNEILIYLRVHPKATRKTIALALSELSEEGVKYHLKKLQGLGVLERVGSTKAGEWRVLI